MRAIPLLIIICYFATGFYGCSKGPNSTYIDSITSSNCYYAGDYITFSCHINGTRSVAIQSILWDFGDGITSTIFDQVQHICANTGTYTVTLTVNDKRLTKTISIASYPLGTTYTPIWQA